MEASETTAKKKRYRLSIRVYLILINLILLFLLFPATGFLVLQESARFRDIQLVRSISQMHEALEVRATTLGRSLSLSAGEAVAGFDFSLLSSMASQLVDNDPEILYYLISDHSHQVVVHQGEDRSENLVPDETQSSDGSSNEGFREDLSSDTPVPVRFMRSNEVLEVTVPVYSGAHLWGVMRCGFSLDKLHQEISVAQRDWAAKMKQFKVFLYTAMGLFFVLGTSVVIFFTRFILISIDDLNAGVRRVASGDLEHEIHVHALACDEFLVLSGAFNTMTYKLRESYKQLQEYSRSLEDKVAERTRDLEKAQASLVKQAHEAGMAEMAVGVLHNIGNAITPAQVGLSMIVKQLQESPLRIRMAKALAPLSGVIERDSVLDDEQKKRLGNIISLIPDSISQEYDQVIDEIRKVKDKHEHVESIIVLQMRYARLMGNFEAINLNQVVNDALQILDDSIKKRQVRVVADLGELPLIRAEEPKLLQILINLIKNGFEAMDEKVPEERVLSLGTTFENGESGQVVITIKDNGCGFNSEDRDKFFAFGYSTKRKGSGFGLHSCANYLIANKGSIEASSEGVGKGATFVIRLPIDTKES